MPLPDDEVQTLADSSVKVTETNASLEQTVYWIDNRDELKKRPTENEYQNKLGSSLWFSIGRGAMQQLTEEKLLSVGLTKMPEILVKAQGVGTYHLSVSNLPSEIRYTDEFGEEKVQNVKWELRPPQENSVEGYYFVNVTDEEQYESTNPGWYYLLETDYEITIHLRWGSRTDDKTTIEEELLKHFQFYVNTNVSGKTPYDLTEINEDGALTITWEDEKGPNYMGTLKIEGLPCYNLDGSRTTYTLSMKEGEGNTFVPEFLSQEDKAAGDYMEASYDNTAVPNFSNETTQVHSGGTLYLTLKGVTDYEATKEWLDPNPESRPEGEFQLWRYRAGEPYTTAAAVRDDTGEILTVKLDKTQDKFSIIFGRDGEELTLPKDDPEGYRYIYVAREYLEGSNAGNYEQVFGKITEKTKEDGSIYYTIEDMCDKQGTVTSSGEKGITLGDDENEGRNGNTFVYDGGTLSNRIKGTRQVSAEKIWKAAAFQAAFGDVRVELTLQYRPTVQDQEKEYEWQNTGITGSMDDFYAEKLTDTLTKVMDQYGPLGRELEYRNGKKLTHQDTYHKTTITNLALKGIHVTKVWKDNDNEYDTRPESINIVLWQKIEKEDSSLQPDTERKALQSEETSDEPIEIKVFWKEVESKTLPAEGNKWECEFKNLPVEDEDGDPIIYKVTESSCDGYESTIESDENGDWTITNTLTGTVDLEVEKKWNDGSSENRPSEPIKIELLRNGEHFADYTLGKDGILEEKQEEGILEKIADLFQSEGDIWKGTIPGLDKYDENGVEYEYTVREVDVPDSYEPSYDSSISEDGSLITFTVTNTILTKHEVEKIWDEDIPEDQRKEVVVGLYANGAPVLGENDEPVTLTLSAENSWKGTFDKLPKYDENGKLYQYTAKELKVGNESVEDSGFEVLESTKDGKTTITNKLPSPEPSVTPKPSDIPKPTSTPRPTSTPTPSGEPTPSVEPSGSPTPTPSEEPSGTPGTTASPTPTTTVRNPGGSGGGTTGTSGGSRYTGTSGGSRSSGSTDSYQSKNARTADSSRPGTYGILLLAGLGTAMVVLQKLRRKEDKF